MKLIKLAVISSFFAASNIASAGQVISLVGDKDGFGGQVSAAVPIDGTQIGSRFDNRSIDDPYFTDVWGFEQGRGPLSLSSPINYVHSYSLLGEVATGASLTIQAAGLADDRGPWEIYFNDFLLGDTGTDGGVSTSKLYSFNVDSAYLTGNDAVSLVYQDTLNEGFAINFSELVITTTSAVSAVPEPSTYALMLGGLGLVGFMAARRRKQA